MTTKRIITLAASGRWPRSRRSPSAPRHGSGRVPPPASCACTWAVTPTVQLRRDGPEPHGARSARVESPNGPLIVLSSTPGPSAPGLVDYGLGVKASPSSATGTPCGQLEEAETLTMSRGTALGGRTFSGLRLDLELTKNAVVKLTLTGPTRRRVHAADRGRASRSDQAGEPGISTAPPVRCQLRPRRRDRRLRRPQQLGSQQRLQRQLPMDDHPGIQLHVRQARHDDGTVTIEGGNDFGPGTANDTLFFVSKRRPRRCPTSSRRTRTRRPRSTS